MPPHRRSHLLRGARSGARRAGKTTHRVLPTLIEACIYHLINELISLTREEGTPPLPVLQVVTEGLRKLTGMMAVSHSLHLHLHWRQALRVIKAWRSRL